MMSLRELLTEEEFGLVVECMEREVKRCRAIAERPVQGYGTATELEKKDQWGYRASEIHDVMSKLSEEFN